MKTPEFLGGYALLLAIGRNTQRILKLAHSALAGCLNGEKGLVGGGNQTFGSGQFQTDTRLSNIS